MISVVISTYNGSKYIEKQLESVRAQSLRPDEVIIQDDCSTDETIDIITRYINKYNLNSWYFFINEVNLGYKENFYRGVKRAKGDYIFLCDQDDEWMPDKIEKMIEVFKQHPEIWALNCGLCLIDGIDRPIKVKCEKNWSNCNFLYSERKLDEISFYSSDYILRHNIGPGCALAIDQRTAEGFIKTYNKSLPHDWHMNLIAAVNGGCAFINKPFIKYRKHSNNVIGANTGIVAGIEKKTNDVRIYDYESRISSYIYICKAYKHKIGSKEKSTLSLLKAMVDFYKMPSVKKLYRARKKNGYKELGKKKVQLWEMLVALHMDELIRYILNIKDGRK